MTTSVVDDDAISSDESLVEEIAVYLYPALRLVGALGVVLFCSTFSKYVCMCLAPQRHCLGSVSYSRLSCCGVIDQAAPNTHPFFYILEQTQEPATVCGYLVGLSCGFPDLHVLGASLCAGGIRYGHGISLSPRDQLRPGRNESGSALAGPHGRHMFWGRLDLARWLFSGHYAPE